MRTVATRGARWSTANTVPASPSATRSSRQKISPDASASRGVATVRSVIARLCSRYRAPTCLTAAYLEARDGPGKNPTFAQLSEKTGAGEGIRTLDPNLGKVVLYP